MQWVWLKIFEPPDAPGFHLVDSYETGPEMAERARDAGAFVSIAHPHWSGFALADARSITAAHSVDIYNHGCATDDAHFTEADHLEGWVKAEVNDPDQIG